MTTKIMTCSEHGEVKHKRHYMVRGTKNRAFREWWSCTECDKERADRRREQYRQAGYYEKNWQCPRCLEYFTFFHINQNQGYCYSCQEIIIEERLKEARRLNKKRQEENLEKYNNFRLVCNTGGVCDILKAHHDLLQDDDDRLTTEFMLELTCGEKAVEKYIEKREENKLVGLKMMFEGEK